MLCLLLYARQGKLLWKSCFNKHYLTYRQRWKNTLARALHVLQGMIWILPTANHWRKGTKRKVMANQIPCSTAGARARNYNKTRGKIQGASLKIHRFQSHLLLQRLFQFTVSNKEKAEEENWRCKSIFKPLKDVSNKRLRIALLCTVLFPLIYF